MLPYFFNDIEKRNGTPLNDVVLNHLPAIDMSGTIFLIIWGMATLMLIRAFKFPAIVPVYVWSYIFICLARMLTIYLVALAPPHNIVLLKDPLTGIFYGEHMITKDLFFSGHTATLFLIFLCLQKPWEKWIAAASLIVVACLLLVQHVHYTIDILMAPLVVYASYRLSLMINKPLISA